MVVIKSINSKRDCHTNAVPGSELDRNGRAISMTVRNNVSHEIWSHIELRHLLCPVDGFGVEIING